LEEIVGFMLLQIYSSLKKLQIPDGEKNGRVKASLGVV
jgi:hypothetical protein